MIIAVLSCSKNEDTFLPFYELMERNFPEHPQIIYFTDGIINPYYKTIPIEHELSTWTKGFREFLNQIYHKQILLMIDDCFIRKPVDTYRIWEASMILATSSLLNGKIACLNFEKSWDEQDIPTSFEGWKKRKGGSSYEVSLMCGLWDREKLLNVIDRDCSPWDIELNQDSKGYDYYINSGDYIIDWGYKTFHPVGKVKGVWTKETIDYLKGEGLWQEQTETR